MCMKDKCIQMFTVVLLVMAKNKTRNNLNAHHWGTSKDVMAYMSKSIFIVKKK